jgi:ABC-type uncharacterized transport system fused permease/ATPase subunit
MTTEGLLKNERISKRQGLKNIIATTRLTLLSYIRGHRDVVFAERLEICFVVLIMLSVVLEVNAINMGFSSGYMFKMMVEGKRVQIYNQLIVMSVFSILSAMYVSAKTYVNGVIARILRRSLTKVLDDKYFGQEAYYRVGHTLDNPDQRMTVDVQEFASLLIVTVDKFLLSPITVYYYSQICYKSSGWTSVAIIYVFFTLSILLQKLIMPRVVKYSVVLEKLEGDLRFAHSTIRNECEPIYLSKAGHHFRRETETSFDRIYSHTKLVLGLQFFLNLIGNLFAYLGGVANYVILYWTTDFTQFTAAQLSEFISRVLLRVSNLNILTKCVGKFQDSISNRQIDRLCSIGYSFH